MIGAVALLRLIGFVSVIVGVRVPGVLLVQYVALFGSMARRAVADLARPRRRARGGDLEICDRDHRTRRARDGELRSGR